MNTKAEISILENGNLCIHAPLVIKYTNGRKVVISPEGLDGKNPDAKPCVQESLVQMIARGNVWMKMIENGKVEDIHELARKTGYHRTHVWRHLQTANLSPAIIEGILEGKEHKSLSLGKLKKPIPESWLEQMAEYA